MNFLLRNGDFPSPKRHGGSITIISFDQRFQNVHIAGATAYSATKAGQVPIEQQLARYKIRVKIVCLGAIDTEIDDNTQIRSENKTAVPVEWPQGTIPFSQGRRDVAKMWPI